MADGAIELRVWFICVKRRMPVMDHHRLDKENILTLRYSFRCLCFQLMSKFICTNFDSPIKT